MDQEDRDRLIRMEVHMENMKSTLGEVKERLEKGDEKFGAINKDLTELETKSNIASGVAGTVGALLIIITLEIFRWYIKRVN